MSIAEKLTTIAENEPKVFDAGRTSVLEGDGKINFSLTGSIADGINKPIRSLEFSPDDNSGRMTVEFTNEDGTSSQSVAVSLYGGLADFVKYENGRVTKGNSVDGIEEDISDTSEGQAVMALYTYDGVTNMTTNGYCNIGYVKSTLKEQYNSGRQAQYDEFWDVYQNYGNGTTVTSAFSSRRWIDEIYHPKYPIKPLDNDKSINSLFYQTSITDTKVPIHAEGCTTDSCFSWSSVKTVPLFVVDENTNLYNCFRGTSSIINITIEGTIACDVTIGSCSKLTSASVDSIIGALKQLAEGDEARTLTLHTTVKANMTDAQIATIQEKGWTLA